MIFIVSILVIALLISVVINFRLHKSAQFFEGRSLAAKTPKVVLIERLGPTSYSACAKEYDFLRARGLTSADQALGALVRFYSGYFSLLIEYRTELTGMEDEAGRRVKLEACPIHGIEYDKSCDVCKQAGGDSVGFLK